MNSISNIPEPFQFSPLKHHLSFIREFISEKMADENNPDTRILVKDIRHIGSSVMDIYTGSLSVDHICNEIITILRSDKLDNIKSFSGWTGIKYNDFKTISISDSSIWTLKYHNDKIRFVHLFPARMSPHSFRVKANTLKSAILYNIVIGKDYISGTDLNRARGLLGLSPVKDTADVEAITEMIEILRV